MSKIDWTDVTMNPVVGCSKVSSGCQNCYAENMARRLAAMGLEQYLGVVDYGKIDDWKTGFIGWNGKTAFVPSELKKPYQWKKPRTIFVGSMGDLFHESVPFEWVDRVMRMVWENRRHTFIFLSKRPQKMFEYFTGLAVSGTDTDTTKRLLKDVDYSQYDHGWRMRYLKGGAIPNLILGVSVEDQTTADERIPVLLQTPAAKRFISLEPMVGPVDLFEAGAFEHDSVGCITPGTGEPFARSELDGVILGGESGPKARPLNPDWVRLVRDQCALSSVPFMFKQWGEWMPTASVDHPIYNQKCVFVHGLHFYKRGAYLSGNHIDGCTHTELAWEVRK